MLTFSNPRMTAEFNDWPIGGANVGKCKFGFESHPKRGLRLTRQTTNKYGSWCKPKLDTYGGPGAIVDGSDGKTYVLQFAGEPYDFLYVKRHDFMHAESVFPDNPRFQEFKDLIAQATPAE
jgi:hypothetical protein